MVSVQATLEKRLSRVLDLASELLDRDASFDWGPPPERWPPQATRALSYPNAARCWLPFATPETLALAPPVDDLKRVPVVHVAPFSTVGEAIAIAQAGRQSLLAETAAQLKLCVAAMTPDVNARRAEVHCAERWPWALKGSASKACLATLELIRELALKHTDTLPAGEALSFPLHEPHDVTPAHVAEWAVPRWADARGWDLGTSTGPDLGLAMPPEDLVSVVERGGRPALFWWSEREHRECPWTGLALLYGAWIDQQPRRGFGPTFGLDSKRHTVETVSALAGVDPHGRPGGQLLKVDGDAVKLVFRWSDQKNKGQLTLRPADCDHPLLAVAWEYGDAAIRDLVAIFALAWARGAKPAGLWIWPEELLDMMGLANNKTNRAALNARLDRLDQTYLEAYFEDGPPFKGAVLRTVFTEGSARQVTLHPALYSGIRDPNADATGRAAPGSFGNYWCPMPVSLVQVPAKRSSGRLHTFGVWASGAIRHNLQALRSGESDCVEVTAARLASRLGINWRDDARRDSRTGQDLERTLRSAQAASVVDRWTASGPLSDPKTRIDLYPVIGTLSSARAPFPASIPATTGELRGWLNKRGWSARDLARQLNGTTERTLQRTLKTPEWRPLPSRVRAALRRWLWPDL